MSTGIEADISRSSIWNLSLTNTVSLFFDCVQLLYGEALSHTISIEVDGDDVAVIKGIVEKVPGFNHKEYRWPMNRNVLKFSAKGLDTTKPFADLWSADIRDVGNVDNRRPIEQSEIECGSKVL